MPIPHHHEGWDETIYGISGEITWRIGGDAVVIGPGKSAFIPRGVVHDFANQSHAVARFLSILTPGVLGPEYFRETADLVNSGQADPGSMKALMARYGLIPSNGARDDMRQAGRRRRVVPVMRLAAREATRAG